MATVPIPLSLGLVALVDEADAPLVSGYTWHAQKGGNAFYAVTHTPRANGVRRSILMHRLITGTCAPLKVDHIDGDGLNNTRGNLRQVTHGQNMANRARHRNNRSGFKGVYWHKEKKRWCVAAHKNGHTVRGGIFKDLLEAAHAYDRLAKNLHGSYCRLNFPE